MTPKMMPMVSPAIILVVITTGYVLVVNNVLGSNGFLTYENPDYNIRMEYPTNWNKSEINLTPHQVAFFYPPDLVMSEGLFEGLFQPNIPPVSFVIEVEPKISKNINESALRSISSFEGDNQSRLVDHNYTTLSGMPAYETVYYNYRNNESPQRIGCMDTLW